MVPVLVKSPLVTSMAPPVHWKILASMLKVAPPAPTSRVPLLSDKVPRPLPVYVPAYAVVDPPVKSSVAPADTLKVPPVLVPPALAKASVPVFTVIAPLLTIDDEIVDVPVPPVFLSVP